MSPFVRPPVVRLGDRLGAWSVFLLLLGIYSLTCAGTPDDPTSELDFQTTRALAHGTLELADTPEARALRHLGAPLEDLVVARPDGSVVSARPIGSPVLGIPLYALGALAGRLAPEVEAINAAGLVQKSEFFAHLATGWRDALCAAWLCFLFVSAARRVGVGRRHAWLSGLLLGLATHLWPRAGSWTIEVPAALFLFLAFHLTLRAREHFARLLRPLRADLLGLGASLAAAVLVEPALLFAALAILGAALVSVFAGYRRLARFALFLRKTWRLGHWVDAGWIALPLLAGVGLAAATPADYLGRALLAPSDEVLGDLLLVFVSPGRGLLWVAPLVLFAPLGFQVAFARGARLWPAAALAILGAVVWAAHPPLDPLEPWGFGPGRLLPALPFLWLGVAIGLERVERSALLRRASYGLCALGLVGTLSGVLVDSSSYQDLLVQMTGVRSGSSLYRTAAWDARLAQPWAHWRILRHRLAGLGESFPPERIFFAGGQEPLTPHRERDRGFAHVAWIDLRDRLGASPHPLLLAALVLAGAGCVTAARALDRALP